MAEMERGRTLEARAGVCGWGGGAVSGGMSGDLYNCISTFPKLQESQGSGWSGCVLWNEIMTPFHHSLANDLEREV